MSGLLIKNYKVYIYKVQALRDEVSRISKVECFDVTFVGAADIG